LITDPPGSTQRSTPPLWTTVDAGLALAVWICSLVCIWLLTDAGGSLMFDCFRDMAWAHNVRAGSIWADPVLAGESFWYAPGNPLSFGFASRILGVAVPTLYASSALWWNSLIPVAVFLLTLRSTDRITALVSLPLVFLGSLWWLTHFAAPMPSIQGTVLGLASILCWQGCMSRIAVGRTAVLRWAAATGLILAACAWYHPVCAVAAAGGIGLQAVLELLRGARRAAGDAPPSSHERRLLLLAVTTVAGGSLLLALPLICHFIGMPHANPVPLQYFAAELTNPDFALQAHTPLIPLLGVVGVWLVLRRRPGAGWLVGYLAVAFMGQTAGYLHHLLGLPVAYLLPHEFQWHTQLAVGILAAISITELTGFLGRRLRWPSDPSLARLLWIGVLLVVVVIPNLLFVPLAGSYLVDLRQVQTANRETAEWIQSDTLLDDVFACDPLLCHLVVAGLTGRKCMAVPVGHMNPAVDARRRLGELSTLLVIEDEAEFIELARQHGVTHLLLRPRSPEEAEHARRLARFATTAPAFRSEAEGTVILELQEPES
jgi:hypothetical protein